MLKGAFKPSVFGPSYFVYLLWVVGGVWGVILSKGVLGVWFSLECGFFGMMFLLNVSIAEELEGAVQYYIFQCLGSLFLFFSLMTMVAGGLGIYLAFSSFVVGITMKMGLFPFHFWVPSVMGKSSWANCFFIAWVQKVGPVFFLSNVGANNWFYMTLVSLGACSALAGGLGGVGVLEYRPIVGYSSVIQSGWLVALAASGFRSTCYLYLAIYGLALSLALQELWSSNLHSFQDHCNISDESAFSRMMVSIHLASLSGMPPFLGGSAKVLGLYCLWESDIISAVVLMAGSAFGLYFYMMMLVNMFIGTGRRMSSIKVLSLKKQSIPFRVSLCLIQFTAGFLSLSYVGFF